MEQRLRSIFAANDWKAEPNKQAERADYYRSLLKQGLSLAQQLPVQMELANELLRAGDSAASVDTLEALLKTVAEQHLALPDSVARTLHQSLALAYLRLGEQDNCVDAHGRRSCIFPLSKEAVHQKTRGAEGAVREYTLLLERYPPRDAEQNALPDDLSCWLLNIAYMQLGKYPAGVPRKWLAPADLFRSEHDIGEFTDVAAQANLLFMLHSGGVAVQDFDGDGLLDIAVTGSYPLDQMRLYHNNGDGTFSDRTAQAGLTGELGGLNLVATDYNNDGHPDLLVLRGGWWGQFGKYPLSLLRNNGDGTFDDVTEQAGLLSAHPTQTAAWADYDNDGWLDLFVGHESTPVGENPPGDPFPSQLFHNNHDGTFTSVPGAAGMADLGWVKGVAWGDYNNDGRPDLYVSVRNGPNHLFRNDGPSEAGPETEPEAGPEAAGHPSPLHWKFTDVTKQAGVAAPNDSFATWFFDYDNDGWPDIFVAGYSAGSMEDVGAYELGHAAHAELPRLYHNNHDGTFTEVSHQAHLDRGILTMGAGFGDLDNDGWLDVYLGNGEPSYEALLPNPMFRNREGKTFQDVTTSGGFCNLQKGHGVAFADFENAGNEDVFEEMGGAFPGDAFMSSLYRNPGHGNHWITLQLEGVQTNRAAFGARIDVTCIDQGRLRHIYRTVGYTSSFGGNPFRQHIGVGQAEVVQGIDIAWPVSATTQHFSNVAVDHNYLVREGDRALRPAAWPAFLFFTLPMGRDVTGMQHESSSPAH